MDLSKYFYKNAPHIKAKSLYSHKRNRYYFLKTSDKDLIVTSLEYDIWSTKPYNEKRLAKDYEDKYNVVLIISSGEALLGYALMKSKPGGASKSRSKFPSVKFDGHLFDIGWIRCLELSAKEYSHLNNKYNNDRSIASSKNGDEIDRENGYELCRLFEKRFVKLLKSHTPTLSHQGLPTTMIPPLPVMATRPGKLGMAPIPGMPNVLPEIPSNFILSKNHIESMMKMNNRSIHDITKMQRTLKGASVYSLDMAAEFNPALIIFPVDLSNMSYDTYISIYNCSHEYWLKMPEDFDFLTLTSFKT
ncbi:uncharacterized protein TOT_020000358 [Theileria orientalis strain Shintoku]|uniref:YTH domain-containing protein n=1 Tax=Theileria orientalis strain Shintoku TaxID=869250 RepID=J4D7C3_THEOR|nr:uncharacterized protein TOT_020000358 [Theileria orientalis strain Shintoku]PVC51090.1 hypothetical protein MACL_00001743 [Theileria orientalis]BAM40095.1 uncharacterized protein TOT_020000358 [Theileria orientalis strain Shintoku]|eukprot:XP_009690396.1 uncharacterized protein TOT_020000358 [Theileria orientalis strain Shintoku]